MDGLEWNTPIKMDDLGGKPTILGNVHIISSKKTIMIWDALPVSMQSSLFSDDIAAPGSRTKPSFAAGIPGASQRITRKTSS